MKFVLWTLQCAIHSNVDFLFHNVYEAVPLIQLLAAVCSLWGFYGNHHYQHLLLDPFKPGLGTFYELLGLTENVQEAGVGDIPEQFAGLRAALLPPRP